MIDKDCMIPRKWLLDYVRQIILPTCRLYETTVLWVKYCPSEKKGLHIYIRIRPALPAVLALKLQFLLGDDCERFSRNRARMRAGFDYWNKLFEKENVKLEILYRSREFC